MIGAVFADIVQTGQWFTIFIMSIVLGLDAFSLSLGIGLRGVGIRDVVKIGSVVATFHFIMPLMGIFAGKYVSSVLGDVAIITGGILLILLGLHMIYSAMKEDEFQPFDPTTWFGLLVFALSVSIDSFSVGISLGLFATDIILAVGMFGLFGGMMSVLGLCLGKQIAGKLGGYGEAIGGAILLAFGIKFLM